MNQRELKVFPTENDSCLVQGLFRVDVHALPSPSLEDSASHPLTLGEAFTAVEFILGVRTADGAMVAMLVPRALPVSKTGPRAGDRPLLGAHVHPRCPTWA